MPHQKSRKNWLSVTEVLNICIDKPYLRYWYGKNGTQLCEQIKRESQELGIAVHELIEERLTNDSKPAGGSRAYEMVDNFWNKFIIPHKVKAIELEHTYEDKKLKLQGTLDAIISCNKGEYIADWKTSNQLDKISVPLQLAAYAKLSGATNLQGVAVRIDKKTDEINILWYENLEQYWEIFLYCLKLAKYIKYGEL